MFAIIQPREGLEPCLIVHDEVLEPCLIVHDRLHNGMDRRIEACSWCTDIHVCMTHMLVDICTFEQVAHV